MAVQAEELERVARLARSDVALMAAQLEKGDVRFLVDLYYQMQEFRKAAANQKRAAGQAEEPALAISWVYDQMESTEATIKRLMDAYTDLSPVGRWAKGQYGIGPVLTAGLLAHIDIERAPTVGHIWRFAGLDPTLVWGKGEKRPFNARLKVLCWKIGDSFVKFSNRDDCFYGKLYRQRKEYEVERDTLGGNSETAAATLEAKKFKDRETRLTYESGHLPAGRLDLRARRWTVKLFLAHLHHVMYLEHYAKEPPKPYVIGIMGHADYIPPPNLEP